MGHTFSLKHSLSYFLIPPFILCPKVKSIMKCKNQVNINRNGISKEIFQEKYIQLHLMHVLIILKR